MAKRWWMIDKLSDSLESAKIDKEICRTILQGWDRLPQKPKPAERAIQRNRGRFSVPFLIP